MKNCALDSLIPDNEPILYNEVLEKRRLIELLEEQISAVSNHYYNLLVTIKELETNGAERSSKYLKSSWWLMEMI